MKDSRLLNVSLDVSIKKEGSVYVAYSLALDASTYGKTKSDAKKNFKELVEIFFEELSVNPDALDIVLVGLGWTRQKNSWKPPEVENIVEDVKVSFAV